MSIHSMARIDRLNQRIAELEADLAAVTQERNALKAALERIATMHQNYEENGDGPYGIGVTDGHRCAATQARIALDAAGKETAG